MKVTRMASALMLLVVLLAAPAGADVYIEQYNSHTGSSQSSGAASGLTKMWIADNAIRTTEIERQVAAAARFLLVSEILAHPAHLAKRRSVAGADGVNAGAPASIQKTHKDFFMSSLRAAATSDTRPPLQHGRGPP